MLKGKSRIILAKEDAGRLLEGYRKGVHTCKVCHQTFIPVHGDPDFKNAVKSLVSSGLGFDAKEGWVDLDGYCRGCKWNKFGVGLKIHVTIEVSRDHDETELQIVDRFKTRLQQLEVPFAVDSYEEGILERRWR